MDISLRLSDQSTSVDQNFTLKVLDSVEDLFFLQTDEISFTETELSPELKIAQINMDEDSN